MIVRIDDNKISELIGNKAKSLQLMKQKGFNVPNGFVIPVDYKLDEKEILAAFDGLNTEYVAVRSSATVEDGSKSSWAGQFSSYLNITRNELIKHIKLVRESVNNPRVIAYAKKMKIKNIKMAVVVQKMIDADISGIAFSINPVNQDSTKVVIEAGLGLGEPIVSGMVTPDTYQVDKDTNTINKTINTQAKALYKDGYQELSSSNQKLDDEKIIELTKEIIKLEGYYGLPVDVEWAYENNKLYILQSRPITQTKTSEVQDILRKLENYGEYKNDGTGIHYSWLAEDLLIKSTSQELQEKVTGFFLSFAQYFIACGDSYLAVNSELANEDSVKEQIDKFVVEKPESVAQLLRNWINED